MPRRLLHLLRSTALAVVLTTGVVIVDVALGACAPGPTVPTPRQVSVTITSDGFQASNLSGGRALIEFVNRDMVPHDIRSDPHPDHDQCRALNVGTIAPGQRVAILAPFERGSVCGFHDDTQLSDGRFRAAFTID